jgi:hypothetical protein
VVFQCAFSVFCWWDHCLDNNITKPALPWLKFGMEVPIIVLYQIANLFGSESVRFLCHFNALFLFLGGAWPYRE